jgi:hypothetical protein
MVLDRRSAKRLSLSLFDAGFVQRPFRIERQRQIYIRIVLSFNICKYQGYEVGFSFSLDAFKEKPGLELSALFQAQASYLPGAEP